MLGGDFYLVFMNEYILRLIVKLIVKILNINKMTATGEWIEKLGPSICQTGGLTISSLAPCLEYAAHV